MEFWYWWVLAVLLAALEMVAPGAVLIWLGAAAALVGLAVWVVPEASWQGQLLAFAVLSIALVTAARLLIRRGESKAGASTLNRRADQYVGSVLTLLTPIVNGHGRAQVGDGLWGVEGPDGLAAGTRVRVTGTDGVTLKVERAD